MAERLNAAVLKTVLPKGNGGSNPSLSAKRYSEAVIDDGVKMMKKGL